MSGLNARVADVPAHNEPRGDPSDFALTNKTLVCCHVCRLVKSRNQVWPGRGFDTIWHSLGAASDGRHPVMQFYDTGCDNCKNIIGPSLSFEDYTTPNFTG